VLLSILLGLWFAAGAVVIEVHGTVDQALSRHVKSALEKAQARHPAAIVFDVDTWGGELDAAFEISDAISGVKTCSTATFVRRKAISAGALIGLSAQRVYMAPGATMGDCAPIIPTEDGPHFLGEKIESPLRARFRALSKRHGVPDLLAEKMVTKDLEVVEARDTSGRREYFTTKNFAELVGEARQRFSSWKILVADGQLLTVDDREALELGFSAGTYASIDSLAKAKRWSLSAPLAPRWSADFALWLADLAPLLFMLGLAFLWIEYKSPGGYLFGLLGVLVLAVALGSKYLLGLSDQIPLLLAALGILLFLIEAWFLPGTVVPAVLGLLCLLGALTMSLQGFAFPDMTNPVQVKASLHSAGIVAGCLFGAMLASLLFVRFVLTRLPARQGVHLDAVLPRGGAVPVTAGFEGREGICVGALRPRGRVEIDGIPIEANCREGFLDSGTRVRVLRADGNGWDVERIA